MNSQLRNTVSLIARNYPTPFYFYDMELLDQTLIELSQTAAKYEYKIHYAVKANHNTRILKKIQSYGLGADCVSGNEIAAALNNGFSPAEIAFAGVGKTDGEIRFALKNNIFCLNCESKEELEVINEIASAEGQMARVALRINPDVNAKTHAYITTGLNENKFGIPVQQLWSIVPRLREYKNIQLTGLHFHIGSQICDLQPYIDLCNKVSAIVEELQLTNIHLKHVNLGGGMGIDYLNPETNPIPDFKTFFKTIHSHLRLPKSTAVHFEPGRSVIVQCGSLITRVLYCKEGLNKKFLIADAGMNDLVRPALYQASHKIESLSGSESTEKYDVVGPVCESSDCFGKALELPVSGRGDVLVIRSAGAYGESMASTYNLRPLSKSYFSDEVVEIADVLG